MITARSMGYLGECEMEGDEPTGLDAATRDQWIGTPADQFRNPLNTVLLALAELQQVCAADAAAGAIRDVAEDASQHAVQVIDDILDLSRNARGNLAIDRQPVEFARVVAPAVAATRGEFARRK